MDPELKRLLFAIIAGQVAWVVKDFFVSNRTQTTHNTEELGALKIRMAVVESDINAAHSSIRDLKGRKSI